MLRQEGPLAPVPRTGLIAPGIGAREGCLRFALFRASVSVIYGFVFLAIEAIFRSCTHTNT
jgi:hypothetical protein